MTACFRVHVVYDNPSDFPGHIVVRWAEPQSDGTVLYDPEPPKWSYAGRGRDAALRRAREHCEGLWLVRMDRHPSDDPVIVETWI